MNTSILRVLSIAATWVAVAACDRTDAAPSTKAPMAAPEVQKAAAPAPAAEARQPANVGAPAPDFALQDLNGKLVRLGDFKGKTVVLEWFNPECPFVKLSHTKGSLKGLADKHTGSGSLVWLAINSGAEGKQGHGIQANRRGVEAFGLKHPVLLDPEGLVGKSYGATNTPHMFIIDPKGTLVYSGAIDNSPDAEGQSPSGGSLVNYVSQALDELGQGKALSVPKTKAYGCSVKYRDG
ncbi:MAG TPA: redoxin family protein [Polyangiaceae bacterium]|nr:redoxin family protein [Polyangiaceae bacterium]